MGSEWSVFSSPGSPTLGAKKDEMKTTICVTICATTGSFSPYWSQNLGETFRETDETKMSHPEGGTVSRNSPLASPPPRIPHVRKRPAIPVSGSRYPGHPGVVPVRSGLVTR